MGRGDTSRGTLPDLGATKERDADVGADLERLPIGARGELHPIGLAIVRIEELPATPDGVIDGVSGTQRSGAALGVERGREEASEGQQESAAHGRRRLWDHRPSRRDAPSRAERAGLTHTGTYVDAERAHRGVGRNGSGGGGRPEERHGGPAVHGRAFVGRACLWAAAVERAGGAGTDSRTPSSAIRPCRRSWCNSRRSPRRGRSGAPLMHAHDVAPACGVSQTRRADAATVTVPTGVSGERIDVVGDIRERSVRFG